MTAQLQYLTDEKGEKKAVVLPIEDYESLLEELADSADAAAIAEAKKERAIPHDEFIAELKRDGIL